MPRYEVVERRSYDRTVVIDAEDSEKAGRLEGKIVEDDDYTLSDSWADDVMSVVEVPGEDDDA